MPPPRLLLVFVEEPQPGQVKPQLAHSVGEDNAARIYQAMVHVLLRQLNGLTDCHLRFCFAPDDADEAVRFWLLPRIIDDDSLLLDPGRIDFAPQGNGDHAEQLQRAFDQGFAEGFDKVGVIGTECIEVSSRWIHAAFAQLNQKHDAAIGLTSEGGYHLLALGRPTPALFEASPWPAKPPLARAAEARLRTYQLPPLTDIKTEGDYKKALLGPLGPALRRAVKELA